MSDAMLKHVYTGKVRELYEVSHDRLLMVASDRVSVFDVVLPDEIPDKGRILTGLSSWWFERTASFVPNHVISADPTDLPEIMRNVGGRAMLVRATRPVRLECVVRGYVFGHGWSEYREKGHDRWSPGPGGSDRSGEASGAALHADDQGRRRTRRVAHPGAGDGAGRSRAVRQAQGPVVAAL